MALFCPAFVFQTANVKKILVTGGTGFIGSHIVRELASRGCSVRVFHRPGSPLERIASLNVEHAPGDIRDAGALRRAMEGCDTVFHTAAMLGFWKPIERIQHDVNVNGTAAVVRACLDTGVTRLVHTSSIAALGHPLQDGDLADETTPYNWSEAGAGYKRSKRLAEDIVLEAAAGSLDACIVNPSVVIGPGDSRFNGGEIIRSVARGLVPFSVRGGMNIAFVGDVARGHILAAERGTRGERYILGGTNVTHAEAFSIVAEVVGKRPPRWELPLPLLRAGALFLDGVSRIVRKPPMISPGLVAGAGMRNWYSSAKAVRELGYTITPLQEAVRQTYEWYRTQGLL